MRLFRKVSKRSLSKFFLCLAIAAMLLAYPLYLVYPEILLVAFIVSGHMTELTIYSEVDSPSGERTAYVYFLDEGAMGGLNRIVSIYDSDQRFSTRSGLTVFLIRGEPFVDVRWESEFSLLVTVVGPLRENTIRKDRTSSFRIDDDKRERDLLVSTHYIPDAEIAWTFPSQEEFAELGYEFGTYTRISGTPSGHLTVLMASELPNYRVSIYDEQVLVLEGKQDVEISKSASGTLKIGCATCEDSDVLQSTDQLGGIPIEYALK